MGITIHYKLAQDKKEWVKSTLDAVENYATLQKKQAEIAEIHYEIRRENENCLYIDIGGCETLTFDFHLFEELSKIQGWDYKTAVLEDIPDKQKTGKFWASGYCKTQYATKALEHKFVADLIRVASSFCGYSEVYDEGDYYHSGQLEDAKESIEKLGVMINGLGTILQNAIEGTSCEFIKGGETKIKSTRKNK